MDRPPRLTRSRVIPAFLLSLCLAACTTLAPGAGGISLEDRPAEGVIRVANASGNDVFLYHNVSRGFAASPLLYIRYRDGAGRIIGYEDGWWTPAMQESRLPAPSEQPRRDRLVVPARGFVDLPRDIAAMTSGKTFADRLEGPCSMQILLLGYLGRWTDRRIEPVTEWQPVPCPEPNVRRAPGR